ncbi:S9 family peptidase [Paraburkholderia sp. Ac-20340]|uniref:alpha/beta hydrolase family protein n=1 Tax=Paraburkholderia sp. Ac-20340 TaxID=2703888 RepID=UPI00197E4628|nr:prolyl oligopeptidase family serine peptidase [Paraburkholderia sp. Ac-20340]MBN3852119.1 S9 family peptidase [Paraburkholderia sp. Ac-20340]
MTGTPANSANPERVSAEQAVAAGKDFGELAASARGVFWTAYDPADAATRLWHWRSGSPARCLTPDGFSVRGRVYEYGGGSFCIAEDAVVFANEKDQQLYRQTIDGEPAPVALTQPGLRYGDLRFNAGAVLAVEEDGGTHRLVSIALADGARTVLAEGADFYAAPCLRADGARLAWIEWQRPHQPWTATQLRSRERDAHGAWSPARTIAGADIEDALQQPQFDANGTLYCLSDRGGFWQPWREQDGTLQALPAAPADHASAPWQLGGRSWIALDDGSSLAAWTDDGWGILGHRSAAGVLHTLAPEYSRFRNLAADDAHFYCLAASPGCPAAVLAIRRDDYRVQVLADVSPMMPPERIPVPERLRFASGDSESHAYFYAPEAIGNEAGAPPVVVFIHGGPTSACYPVFDPRIPYWTQRGFAVVNLNYRGSTGYGRAYRQALHESWGVVDVDDACNVVAHLAAQQRIDPARAFIRGSSAGGYTTLCALAFREIFRGGASLYGVSDPLTLGQHTHKFEADYLDWLIGDAVADAERYRARTPLWHADRIRVPVAFFQGELDAVVTPDQTRSMVSALQANGVATEAHYYADERHGFRKAVNQAHALQAEYAFYCGILGQAAL